VKYYYISTAIILEVSGKDSPRYLQSRLTNNIKSLSVNSSCPAAQITPQGKTQGIFTVYKVEETRFILVCNRGNPDEVISAFKKYIVADRVTVENITEKGAKVFCVSKTLSVPLTDSLLSTTNNSNDFRVIITLNSESENQLLDIFDKNNVRLMSEDEYDYLEFTAGIPRFGKELTDQVLFSESGYDDAIAANKGCYVGQEVVEKIESFGKTPKIFKRLITDNSSELQEAIPEQTSILLDGTEIGRVVSAHYDKNSNHHLVFVRIKNDERIDMSNVIIAGNKVLDNVDTN
jgi:folate-binding protein YgfZ